MKGSPCPKCRANTTASKALPMSCTATITPGPQPISTMALDAPRFLEPAARRSTPLYLDKYRAILEQPIR